MIRPGASFIWPLAYDWRRGAESIARCWSYGDEHIVSWDLGGRTWGGGMFAPPSLDAFCLELAGRGVPARETRDPRRLRFVLGDFHMPGVNDLGAVETRQRNAITWLARPGNLLITLDADEEPINWPEFATWMGAKQIGATAMMGQQCPIYKIIGDTALVFPPCRCPVAIGVPGIWDAPRGCYAFSEGPLKVVNWFLAGRDRAELEMKLGAMTYMIGYDAPAMLAQWERTTLDNYGEVSGFAGTYVRAPLVPISLEDLWAGRWDTLYGRRPEHMK